MSASLLLLTAAGFQLWSGLRTDFALEWIDITRASVATVTADAVIGVWLLTGVWKDQARLAGALLFSVYGVAAAAKLAIGAASCGCLGSIQVPPLLTAPLAIGFALLLFLALPPARK